MSKTRIVLGVLASLCLLGAAVNAQPVLRGAFIFGSRALDCETPNAPGTKYTVVHHVNKQPDPIAYGYDGHPYGFEVIDPGNTARGGFAQFGPFDDSANNRNAFGDACPEQIYDSFIGFKNFTNPCNKDVVGNPNSRCSTVITPEGGIFRVDVPNGLYRFVLVVGDADNPHAHCVLAEDGGSGPPSNIGSNYVVLIQNHDQAQYDFAPVRADRPGAGVFGVVGFDDKLPPQGDGVDNDPAFVYYDENGLPTPEKPNSPILEVTQGYIRIHLLQGNSNPGPGGKNPDPETGIGSPDPNGGDIVLLEIWQVDCPELPVAGDPVNGSGSHEPATACACGYKVSGVGSDIWGSTDGMYYLHSAVPLPGNFDASVKVVDFVSSNGTYHDEWGKAGIMARTSLEAGSPNNFFAITTRGLPGSNDQRRLTHQWRDNQGANSGSSHTPAFSTPVYLRLQRVGDTFYSYWRYSKDEPWHLFRTHTTAGIGNELLWGFAVTNHAAGADNPYIAEICDINFVDLAEVAVQDLTVEETQQGYLLKWTIPEKADITRFEILRYDGRGVQKLAYNLDGSTTEFLDTIPVVAAVEPTWVVIPYTPDGPGASAQVSKLIGGISSDGRVTKWLIIGHYSQPYGCGPGKNMLLDYLTEGNNGPKTEENILPVDGMEILTDYSVAASTGCNAGNEAHHNCNPLKVFAVEVPDGYVNFNSIFGDVNNVMTYMVCYLTNNTDDVILARLDSGSDDSILIKLDNAVWHFNSVCRGYNLESDKVPIVITPGEHRLMVKVFEGGGGHGAGVRFRDWFTGQPLPPLALTVSLEPTMTEVPPPPPVTAKRELPCATLDPAANLQVTIHLDPADTPVNVYELVPPPFPDPINISDGGVWDPAGRTIAWIGVQGQVSYELAATPGAPDLFGVIETTSGLSPIEGPSSAQPIVATDLGDGWVSADIGGPAIPGNTDASQLRYGCLQITGSGGDIWGTGDQFQYAWREASGNFYMEATIQFFGPPESPHTNDWAKAGIMFRARCDANSAYGTAQWRMGPNSDPRKPGYLFAARSDFGSGAWDTGLVTVENLFPHTGRLVKVGDTVSAYFSADGVNWVYRGSVDLPDEDGSGTFLAGLYVTSHNNGALATARFCNIRFEPLPDFTVTDFKAELVPSKQAVGPQVLLTWSNNGNTYAGFMVSERRLGETGWREIARIPDGSAERFVVEGPRDTALVEYKLTAYAGSLGNIPLGSVTAKLFFPNYVLYQHGVWPTPDYAGCQDAHIIYYRSADWNPTTGEGKQYNTGGHNYIEEGDWFGSEEGHSGHDDHKEILIKFDIGEIPGSVESAQLLLYYAFQRRGGIPWVDHISYAIPVVKHWNEGTGTGVDGRPAQEGEVTWQSAEFPLSTWTSWNDPTVDNSCNMPVERSGGAYGPQDINLDYAVPCDAPYGAQGGKWVKWDITEIVKAWTTGELPNEGLKISQTAFDAEGKPVYGPCADYVIGGYDFVSRNHADASLRPILVIKYEPFTCPTDFACQVEGHDVHLTWTLQDTYTSLTLLGAPGGDIELEPTASSYDLTLPCGQYTFTLVARKGASSCELTCEASVELLCPEALSCEVSGLDVTLSWTNADRYTKIAVLLDGQQVDELAGDAESATLTDLEVGEHTIAIVASDEGCDCAAVECTVEVKRLFVRGDVNADGTIDIADPVKALLYMFAGAQVPCLDAVDANDDGSVNVADAVTMLNAVFGLSELAPPTQCGPDPTEEDPDLGCESYPPCR